MNSPPKQSISASAISTINSIDRPTKAFMIVLAISCTFSLIGLIMIITQKRKPVCERDSKVIIIGILFGALGVAFIVLTLVLIAISSWM